MIFRPEYIAAALHRARTWCDDHPPANGPELSEGWVSRRSDTCKRGHAAIVERKGKRFCIECDRLRKRKGER